jgi:putative autoinducer-2 (AI-2) aldolase
VRGGGDGCPALNVCAVAAQVYIGSEHEHQSINNIIKLVDAGTVTVCRRWRSASAKRWRATRYFSLASRIAAEMGRSLSKPICRRGFEKVTASAGADCDCRGKKLPEHEALEMCFRAIDQGRPAWTWGAISSSPARRSCWR